MPIIDKLNKLLALEDPYEWDEVFYSIVNDCRIYGFDILNCNSSKQMFNIITKVQQEQNRLCLIN